MNSTEPCRFCEKPSCRPEGYAPLCARHYLRHVDDIERGVIRRAEAAGRALAATGPESARAILAQPLEDFMPNRG